MSYDDEDLFDPLDPDATVSGAEGVAAANMEQYHLRRRLLEGDEDGIDLVERLRFHAERGYFTPISVSTAIMYEAAAQIEELR